MLRLVRKIGHPNNSAMSIKHNRCINNTQKGFALIISMVLLFIAAGLGITILINTTVASRVQRNSQDILLAQQAADFAVAEAQKYLLNTWCYTTALCSGPPCTTVWNSSAFTSFDPATQNWANGKSAGTFTGTFSAPLYMIVYMGYDRGTNTQKYLIMTQGRGVQSTTYAYDSIVVTIPTLSCGSASASSNSIRVLPSINGASGSIGHLPPVSRMPAPGFYSSSAGTICPTQTLSAMAWCESDGLSNARVAGWSSQDTYCLTAYGAWTSSGGSSTIRLLGNTLTCQHQGAP